LWRYWTLGCGVTRRLVVALLDAWLWRD
jgi:hypothetical protein